MGKKANPAVIGAFVIGAAVLAIIVVVALGSGRLFRKAHDYVLFFQGDVNGLRVGAPVKFKGVQIGTVTDIRLNLKLAGGRVAFPLPSQIRVPVVIELNERILRSRGATEEDLSDPRFMKGLVAEGLRGQLATESFVTGLLYVNLGFYPGTKPDFVLPPGSRYMEIPTEPNTFQRFQDAAARLVSGLDQIDFTKVMASTTETLDAVKQIVASPQLYAAVEGMNSTETSLRQAAVSLQRVADEVQRQVGPLSRTLQQSSRNASATMVQARAALGGIHTTLQPSSPLVYQTRQTLRDVSSAAQAVQQLAQYLQRNPDALVRGRDYSRNQ